MSDAVITMTGNSAQLVAENEKANKTIDRLTVKLQAASKAGREQAQMEREGIRLTKEHASAMELYALRVEKADKLLKAGTITVTTHRREVEAANRALADSRPAGALQQQLSLLASQVTTVGAIGLAWKAASVEFDNYVERQKKQAEATISFADASREMMLNFVPDATMGVADLKPAIDKISRETGADQAQVAQAFSDTFSSKGDMPNKGATEFVAQAFRLAPKSPELAKEMAARALDLSAQTGVADPKSLLGFLSQVQGQSRITSMPQLGKQGVPAILGGMKGGASLEQSAELFAAINNLMKDAEGANSKTAMLQLVGQLTDEEKMKKAGLSKAFAGKGVMDRLAMLQGDQKLADKFLKADGVSFEVQAKPFIEGLVRGDAASMAALGATRKGIGGIDASSPAAFEELVKRIESGPGQSTSQLDAKLGAIVSTELIGGNLADAGVVRERLFNAEKGILGGKVQEVYGPDFLSIPGLKAQFDAGAGTPQERGIQVLQTEMAYRRQNWSEDQYAGPNAKLQEMVDLLKASLDEQRKGNAGQNAPQAPQVPLFGNDPALNPQPGAR